MIYECTHCGCRSVPLLRCCSVCDTPHFEDNQQATLINPTGIIEVLWATTEAYNRGAKFEDYRRIEPLVDYVLITHTLHRIMSETAERIMGFQGDKQA